MNIKGNEFKLNGFAVIKYWDTYIDTVYKDGFETFDEAETYCLQKRRGNNDGMIDFYVFDENEIKKN